MKQNRTSTGKLEVRNTYSHSWELTVCQSPCVLYVSRVRYSASLLLHAYRFLSLQELASAPWIKQVRTAIIKQLRKVGYC